MNPSGSRYFDPRSVKVKRRPGDVWIRLLPWAYGVVSLLMVTLVIGIFVPVVKKNSDLQHRKIVMEQKLEDAKTLNLKLQQEYSLLQNDPLYVERKARDVLNLGRPGETIFRFPEYKSSEPTRYKIESEN